MRWGDNLYLLLFIRCQRRPAAARHFLLLKKKVRRRKKASPLSFLLTVNKSDSRPSRPTGKGEISDGLWR